MAAAEVGMTVVRDPSAGATVVGGELEGVAELHEARTTPDTENTTENTTTTNQRKSTTWFTSASVIPLMPFVHL